MYNSIIIGTGFSGICMGIQLKQKGIHNFIILEKAKEVGGTWRENTYPGAECDVPSALYSFSFEPYPDWEYKWSHQPQILEYLKMCVKKYDLESHIHFQRELTATNWNEADSFWEIKTKDGSTFQSKTFIPAVGQLHFLFIPRFTNQENFVGVTFHSARWNHDISLEGKTVGVIGNAASAIQFIPEIRKEAKKVIVFQRSANWILPKQDRLYRSWEKNLVKRFPFLLKMYRLKIWLMAGALFLLMNKGYSLLRNFFQWQSKRYISKSIKDPKLREELLPKFPLGAKRVLFSDEFYDALDQENVDVVTNPIQEFSKKGIQTKDGGKYDLDVLIYSTGFKTQPFLMGLEVVGKNGISIKEFWKNGPINYLGMTVSNFPNLFLMYGPNTNLGHNSIILMIEAQAKYIAECVETIAKNEFQILEVKKEVRVCLNFKKL
jgi:cation diffusion facilitator CzcD-associated flavoprotein CzcO